MAGAPPNASPQPITIHVFLSFQRSSQSDCSSQNVHQYSNGLPHGFSNLQGKRLTVKKIPCRCRSKLSAFTKKNMEVIFALADEGEILIMRLTAANTAGEAIMKCKCQGTIRFRGREGRADHFETVMMRIIPSFL